MSRYTYVGDFVDPTGDFTVIQNPKGKGYIVGVKMSATDVLEALAETPARRMKSTIDLFRRTGNVRPHTNGQVFAEHEDAIEWIEGVRESFENDHEDYLNENRFEIAQMERYEAFRNEY